MSLMEMLHYLDDPESLEVPADYSLTRAATSFDRLALQIESRFSVICKIDRRIQDSAQYGRIEVPATATICGTRIIVLVSKFSPLVMVAADNPGAFFGTDEARAEGRLDVIDLDKVEQVIAQSGYVSIPEEILTVRYDGSTLLQFHGSGEPSWWDRFFGTF